MSSGCDRTLASCYGHLGDNFPIPPHYVGGTNNSIYPPFREGIQYPYDSVTDPGSLVNLPAVIRSAGPSVIAKARSMRPLPAVTPPTDRLNRCAVYQLKIFRNFIGTRKRGKWFVGIGPGNRAMPSRIEVIHDESLEASPCSLTRISLQIRGSYG